MCRILTFHLNFCQPKRVIFFARFAIFAITCISNWIATKFEVKDAYLLILELAVKLVWSSGSCDQMNSSAPIIIHFKKPGVLKQCMDKGCLWSSSLQRPQNQLFFPFVSDTILMQALYLLHRLDFLRIFLYATLLMLFVFSCL